MVVNTRLVLMLGLSLIGVSSIVAASMVYPVWVEDSPAPSARTNHDVIQDSKGNLWLFGGSAADNSGVLGDLYKMDVRNNYTWSFVDTSSSLEVPSPRRDFCWSIDKNDNIFLYGGSSTNTYNADKPLFGDLWMFNTTSLLWSLLRNTSTLNLDGRSSPGAGSAQSHPGARVLMTCWFNYDTNTFWIFGGYIGFSTYGDVWSYAIDSGIWSWTSGKYGTDYYSDSDVQIGVPYTDKFPGSVIQASSTADPDGNVWIYGGWLISNYCNQLWRFKMTTLEWTFFGGNFTRDSLETARFYGVFYEVGTFSPGNYPPANLEGALVYAGNGKLAFLTNTFVNKVLYMSQNLWYYDIATNQWAMMYLISNATSFDVQPNRGTFQKVDPTANIGTRVGYGRSRTIGNIWVTRGLDTLTTDTFIFPATLCSTDISPCSTNADCIDHLGWADCTCKSGYEGDGKTCNSVSGPQSNNLVPSSKIKAQNSTNKLYAATMVYLSIIGAFLFY